MAHDDAGTDGDARTDRDVAPEERSMAHTRLARDGRVVTDDDAGTERDVLAESGGVTGDDGSVAGGVVGVGERDRERVCSGTESGRVRIDEALVRFGLRTPAGTGFPVAHERERDVTPVSNRDCRRRSVVLHRDLLAFDTVRVALVRSREVSGVTRQRTLGIAVGEPNQSVARVGSLVVPELLDRGPEDQIHLVERDHSIRFRNGRDRRPRSGTVCSAGRAIRRLRFGLADRNALPRRGIGARIGE